LKARDRFNRLMNYDSIDRPPVIMVEPYEVSALERWNNEGLIGSVENFLGMDRLRLVPVDFFALPRFKNKIIFEDEKNYIEIDPYMGTTVKRKKLNPNMYYGNIGYPVKDRKDWEKYKKRFDYKSFKRKPFNLDCISEKLNNSQEVIALDLYPFFFRLGFYAMGMENFLKAFYDMEKMVHEMFSYWADFTINVLKPYLSQIKIDIVNITEDLAYNSGPHISPDMYKKFWLPYQNKVVDELLKHDIKVICLWSAGDIDVLIPMLLDNGVNCISAVERCSSNMNPIKLRKKYGKKLLMLGGISKNNIIRGPENIDGAIRELMPLIKEGGFMPTLDDMVSPDMSFSHFKYFVKKLQSIKL